MASRWTVVVAAILLCSSSVFADAEIKAPMTPADLWSIDRPSSVTISPDGKRIAYQLTVWDVEANTSNTDLWWVPSAGGDPVRLTYQKGRDASPRWSADGKHLYFLSKRGEAKTQLYKLPAAGGEAERITDMPNGVGGYAMSADGQRILVSSTSYRNCEDIECVEKMNKKYSERVETGRVYDHLLYRHWSSWRHDERSHVYLIDLSKEDASPIDLTPGDVDCPPVSLGSRHDFVITPDGSMAALVVNRSELVAASTDNDVELLDLNTMKRTTISPGNGNDSGPRFSPDGKWIAWSSQERPGYESDLHKLVLYDIANKSLKRVFDDDLSMGDFQFVAGGKEMLFTAQEKGRYNLYRVDVRKGKVSKLVEGGRLGGFDLSADGKTLAYILESMTEAPEIYSMDLASGKGQRLSGHSDDVMNRVELGERDEMWFAGADGDQVHAWIVHPPKSTKKAGKTPVVWLIHGGPQGAWLDSMHQRWSMQQFAAMGYYVVAINFHGSSSYGQEFMDSINQNWGGRPFEDLIKGLDAAKKKLPEADLDRVCAAGGSYGGYMVNWLLGHTEGKFRCYVSHAGVYDLRSMYGSTEELWFPEWDLGGTFWDNPEGYEKWSPSVSAAKFKTPTLVIHGQLDFRVPVTQGMQLFTALQRQGVPSKFLYYPDEGHWVLSPANANLWWSEIDSWFKTWLEDDK